MRQVPGRGVSEVLRHSTGQRQDDGPFGHPTASVHHDGEPTDGCSVQETASPAGRFLPEARIICGATQRDSTVQARVQASTGLTVRAGCILCHGQRASLGQKGHGYVYPPGACFPPRAETRAHTRQCGHHAQFARKCTERDVPRWIVGVLTCTHGALRA